MEFKHAIQDFVFIYDDMKKQFPPEELKPFERLQELLGKNYQLYQIIDNEPIGYIILFEEGDYILIDYLAVYQKFHCNGYGKKILEELKNIYPDKKGCFLEVEKPDKNNINTLRRINFYEKHGAVKLGINYLYPASDKPFPMDLYFIPYKDIKPGYNETKQFISSLFHTVHSDIKNINQILNKIFC